MRSSREELVVMQDIRDVKIRGYLQKACDTNSASERSSAFKLLLSALSWTYTTQSHTTHT